MQINNRMGTFLLFVETDRMGFGILMATTIIGCVISSCQRFLGGNSDVEESLAGIVKLAERIKKEKKYDW